MPPISVVIADRGKAGRAACRSLLEAEQDIRVVGEARSGLDAVTIAEQLKPSILLVDLALLNGSAMALLPVIRRKSPRTRVLLLTKRASEARILEALCHGARGYLEKGALGTYLPRAVRAVDAGEAWVPRKMVAKIMDRFARFTDSPSPRRPRRVGPRVTMKAVRGARSHEHGGSGLIVAREEHDAFERVGADRFLRRARPPAQPISPITPEH